MRIAILGTGALGSLVAARLLLAGRVVVAIDHPGSVHLAAIAEQGLVFEEPDGRSHRLRLPIRPAAAAGAEANLVLVLVKAWATEAAVAALRGRLRPGTAVLTLQNGLGNAAAIRRGLGMGPEGGGSAGDLLVGVTSQAARRMGPGRVRQTGSGPTVIGREDGRVDDLPRRVAAAFSEAGLPTVVVGDIERHVWRKLAVNAGINGPTALAGLPNGAIASRPDLGQAAEILAGEVEAVARARGLELGDTAAAVAEVARATSANRSSMLQDLEQGRRTEVDAIYGAVVAEAARVGLAVPATRVVAALLAAREERAAAPRAKLGLDDGSEMGANR